MELPMFRFRTLNDDDPILNASPLIRALDFLCQEFEDNPKGIKLTKNLFFNLKLVERAIPAVDWPDWGVDEIYHRFRRIKVAHEDHFEPLMVLHDALLQLKLVRRHKGCLILTPRGREIIEQRFRLFDLVAQHWILENGFFWRSRMNLMGNWDIWLNVIDEETRAGTTGCDLRTVFYGPPEPGYDGVQSDLRNGVLLPLLWVGLMEEHFDNGRRLEDRTYSQTPLWSKYLELDDKGPMLRVVN